MTVLKNSSGGISRREVLKLTAAGAAATSLSSPFYSTSIFTPTNKSDLPAFKVTSVQDVLKKLYGPLASITIPFNKDFSIDYGALSAWVELMCEKKAPILFHTLGDGEIAYLSEAELEKIIRTVAKVNNGRALFVGGTGQWWTDRMVNFINRVSDSGVDAMNVHLMKGVNNEDMVIPAFEKLCESTKLPLVVYDVRWPTPLVEKLSKMNQIVGDKCHGSLYQFFDKTRDTIHNNYHMLGPGQMKQYLFGGQIGSTGYLCPLAPLAPQISMRFYDAMRTGDYHQAQQIVFDYEEPLMKTTIPIGYPQAYKTMLMLAGIYKNDRIRPPRQTNIDLTKRKELKECLIKIGVIKESMSTVKHNSTTALVH